MRETTPFTTFRNVEEYLLECPESVRLTLEIVRQTIKAAASQAEEVISYPMPAYKYLETTKKIGKEQKG